MTIDSDMHCLWRPQAGLPDQIDQQRQGVPTRSTPPPVPSATATTTPSVRGRLPVRLYRPGFDSHRLVSSLQEPAMSNTPIASREAALRIALPRAP